MSCKPPKQFEFAPEYHYFHLIGDFAQYSPSKLLTEYYGGYLHSETWQFTLFFYTLAGILILLSCFRKRGMKITDSHQLPESFWDKLFVLFLIIYIGVTLTVALTEYSIFENFEDMDTNIQSYAQTLKGKFFVSYLERVSFKGMNVMLGTHTRPILLLILPFFALFPSGETLLVFKTLFIGFSAIPLYAVFRMKMDSSTAFVLTVSYLFFPPLISQHFTGFHEVCLAPLLIAGGIYFFETRRLGRFLFMYILALMVKEHVGIILLPYIIIAFLRKRDWRWIVFPVVLSVVWIIVTFGFIIPMFRPDDCLIYAHYTVKSHGDTGITGLMSTIVLNPGETLQTLQDRFYFIYIYFSQTSILPFFTPESLFLILPLLKNILFFPYDPPVTFHHSMISAAFLFYATSLVLARIIHRGRESSGGARIDWKPVIIFFILGTTLINAPIWLKTVNLVPASELQEMKEAVSIIPDDIRVAAPMNMTQKLAPRCEVVYLDYLTIKGEQAVDYIIINTHRDFRPIRNSPKKGFLKTGKVEGYEMFWEKGGIIVLKRKLKVLIPG